MLKEKGIKIAVVSNNSKESVERALEVAGVRDLVDLVIGRTSLSDVKPDPSPIVKALNGLGVKSDKVVFVGDSESDMIAAGKAGVRFIKSNSIRHSVQEII
jgi:pyrophosphatase PpaX